MSRWPCPPDLSEDKRCSVCGATAEPGGGGCPGPQSLVPEGFYILAPDEFQAVVEAINAAPAPSSALRDLLNKQPIWDNRPARERAI